MQAQSLEYKNKLVFITGGSEGIGKEVAKEFAKLGSHVVILSRSSEKLKTALSEMEGLRQSPGQKFRTQVLDVTNLEQVESIVSNLVQTEGAPDYLINCAGFARPGYIEELDISFYHKMMDLNYFGIVNVCKAVIPHMMKRKSGSIVNTSSMAGFIGLFGYSGYCASKYAVVGFSEALLRELKPFGINVYVLCPPNTRTPGLVEENRYKPSEVLKTEEKAKPVDPDLVAKSLLKGLKKSKFMIVPTFDGGLAHLLSRFAPSVLNQFVKRPSV